MKSELIRLSICLVVFLLLRYLFSLLGNDQLLFLLAPVNKVVELYTGLQAIYLSEVGYFHESLGIVVDHALCGYHFLLISFLMTSFILIRTGISSVPRILLFSLVTSYLLTLVVNITRVWLFLTSLHYKKTVLADLSLDTLKLLSGVVAYIVVLILFYLALVWVLSRYMRKKDNSILSLEKEGFEEELYEDPE